MMTITIETHFCTWETFRLGMVEKPNDIERGCVRESC